MGSCPARTGHAWLRPARTRPPAPALGPDARGRDCPATWRWRRCRGQARPVDAEASFDHRLVYLDYEGPVSGDRGRVRRVDAGTFAWRTTATGAWWYGWRASSSAAAPCWSGAETGGWTLALFVGQAVPDGGRVRHSLTYKRQARRARQAVLQHRRLPPDPLRAHARCLTQRTNDGRTPLGAQPPLPPQEEDEEARGPTPTVKDSRDREKLLQKIHMLSPWWKEPAAQA